MMAVNLSSLMLTPTTRVRKCSGAIMGSAGVNLIIPTGPISYTPAGGDDVLINNNPLTLNLNAGWGALKVMGGWKTGTDKLNISHVGSQITSDVSFNGTGFKAGRDSFNLVYGSDTAYFGAAYGNLTATDFTLQTGTTPALTPRNGFAHIAFGTQTLTLPSSTVWLQKQKALGATWVRFAPYYIMDTPTSNAVHSQAGTTFTDAELTSGIQTAKTIGLRVVLTPTFSMGDGSYNGSISPTSVSSWFSSYTSMLTHWAAIAQSQGVDLFCIGGELDNLQGSGNASNWSTLATAVRAVFSGPLTFYTQAGVDASGVLPSVDLIGVQCYFALSTNIPEHNVATLVSNWTAHFTAINALSAANSNKHIFISEIGYQSTNDAAVHPGGSVTNVTDQVTQDACYQALFQAIAANANSAFDGAMFWTGGPARGVAPAQDYLPFDKIAASTIQSNW